MARTTHTKEKIEESALRLFVERGVAETSIKDVAQAAGVSQGAMYNHYKSKDELAWSLFEDNFTAIANDFQRLSDDHPHLPGRVNAMVHYIFARFDQDPLPVTAIFFARHDHLRRLPADIHSPYRVFTRVVADAIAAGEIPNQNWHLATSLVIGAAVQVVEAGLLGILRGPLTEHSDEVARACLRILNYQEAPHA